MYGSRVGDRAERYKAGGCNTAAVRPVLLLVLAVVLPGRGARLDGLPARHRDDRAGHRRSGAVVLKVELARTQAERERA